MKNEFEKIEKGLRLLKEEGEKNMRDIGFVNKFLNAIEKEKVVFIYSKWNYSLVYLTILLIFLNLFFIHKLNLHIHKLNLHKENMVVFNDRNIENQPLIIEKEKIEKEKIEIKYIKKQNLNKEKLVEKNIGEEKLEKFSQPLKLEETIKFTEEINKLLGLFTINLNIEGNNGEG
ncbi:MAG: hypothetical protein NC915_01820 [Candidatus Omnitrophica bacterium]|nr:hypothetical protein [Candidatus Omnitrophota bacterium]